MYPSKSTGFTLIELLIVLVIMSLAVGLVVPNVGSQLDRVQRNADVQKLRNTVEFLRTKSYFEASAFSLLFESNILTVKAAPAIEEEPPLQILTFDHVTFPNSDVLHVEHYVGAHSSQSLIIEDKQGNRSEVFL